MNHPDSPYLIIGAALSAAAAVVHVGAVIGGGAWYRFLGAGERMAKLAEAGNWRPTIVTLAIASMLLAFSLYALSGAGIVVKLPLLRIVLCAITAIYLLRAVGFLPLMPLFPGNSVRFWLVSSSICLALGVIHLIGLHRAWAYL